MSFTDELSTRWLALSDELRRRLGAGAELDPATRETFEHRLGVDLSMTLVHTQPVVRHMAQQADARAFAHGAHVFTPSATSGAPEAQALLGHELTHVAQHVAAVQRSAQDETVARFVEGEVLEASSAFSTMRAGRGRRPSAALVADGVYRKLLDELRLGGL